MSAGHQVLVLSRKQAYPSEEEEYPVADLGNVSIIRWHVQPPLTSVWALLAYLLALLSAPAMFLRTALRWKAEVIHVQELPFSAAALLVARFLRIPIVLEMRQPYPNGVRIALRQRSTGFMAQVITELVVRGFTLFEILMCSWTNHVICISDEEKSRLVRLGVPDAKITVIMHLPRIAEVWGRGAKPSKDSSSIIVYAGFLDNREKGVNLLLEAFRSVLSDVPEARLVVLGGGPSRGSLERLARELSIEEKTRFLGWLKPEDAFDFIRTCDVGVVPHQISTMPNKLFTYMHCGKPIVASDFPGVRGVLEKAQCGLLFRPGDSKDLVEKLRTLLLDKPFRSRLSANAKTAAMNRYNWEIESKKLLDIYFRMQVAKNPTE